MAQLCGRHRKSMVAALSLVQVGGNVGEEGSQSCQHIITLQEALHINVRLLYRQFRQLCSVQLAKR